MRKIHIFLMALFSVLVCPQIVEAAITIKVTAPNGLIGYNQYGYEDLRSAIYIRYWNDSISAQTSKMYSYGDKYYSVTFNDNIKTINFQIQIIDEWRSIITTDTFSNITESISIELGDWDPENGIYNNSTYEYEYPMDYTITESANWTLDTVTLYLNNQLLGGVESYLSVSVGQHNYENRSNPVLTPLTKATLLSDGWYSYSFMFDPSSPYNVEWSSYSIKLDTTISYSLSNQQGTDNAYDWYEYYDYDYIEYRLRTTTLRPLDATNSYTIHVDQPGSMAYLILEAAEQWTNVRGLTITGTLNDEDMKYFSYMKNLQRLDLSGADITSIHGCSGLKCLQKVILPESVTEIGASAFNGCVRLYDINLSNITTIGKSAFCNSAITSLYLPKATTIGADAFSSCSELASINLPVATTIEDYTFRGCFSLSYITFPFVTTIGEGAFRLYDNGVYGDMSEKMKEIDLSNVTSLGKEAFSGVSTLEKVILSDELEVLPERCFFYCKGLKEINIPSALKAIGNEALYSTAIEDLTLPEGVTTIDSRIFCISYDSSDLKTLTLPSTLRNIASDAFVNCDNLTDVYLYRIIPPTTAMGFNEDITLHVPAISLLDYKLSDTWNHIDNIVPIDGDATPITHLLIDNSYSLLSAEGFASKVDFDLHAGAEFTIGNNATLNIGTFTQTIGTNTNATRIYYDENGDYMYDEEGNRIYKYYSKTPYNASFINYATLSAENVVIRLVPQGEEWVFFSLPFDVRIQDITIDAMGIGTQGTHQWVIREYSGANRASGNGDTWLNVPADGTLKAHQGYILYWVCEGGSSTSANNFYYYFNLPAANTSTAQQMFTKDNVIVPLTEYMAESEQNRNWNLVGNPYPSFFDIQHMDFNAPITTWNGYGYQAYSLLDDSYRLRPAEAFFVQAPQGTNAIVFNQEGRSLPNMVEITKDEYYNKNGYYAPQRKQTATTSARQVYNFLISNADYTDKARLVLNESARTTYDMTCDAAKMMSSNASVPQIYVNNNGTRYAIDERPAGNGEYILGVNFGKADTYTLQLQSTCSDQQILLIDTETNLSVDLSQTPYSFTANAGDNPSRFRITIKQGVTTDTPTQVVPSSQPYKTIENGQLIIVQPNGKKYSVGGIQL